MSIFEWSVGMSHWSRLFFVLFFILFPSLNAWAGGSHQTTVEGVPLRWEDTLTYNLDKGNLKEGVSQFSHANAAQMVEDAFNIWLSALPSGGLSIIRGEDLPLAADGLGSDVNRNNFQTYLSGSKAVNAIVFDADGEIIDAMFGECSKFSTLAFAGFSGWDESTGTIKKARAVFSGACIPDAAGKTLTKAGCGACVNILDEAELRAIILHELGHLLGMDHSQVNPDSYATCKNLGNCSDKNAEEIPTMFPKLVNGANMETLHRDDIAYFQRLYGNPESSFCSVSGKIFANDGQTELRGAEVVARNTDAALSHTDAISFVSGAEAPRLQSTSKDAENCVEDCGSYLISGLSPGETYQLCVQKILSQFVEGSGINPVDPPVQDFADECPDGLTVTCQCFSGKCDSFVNRDITTQADANGLNAEFDNSSSQNFSGGCSLVKPRTMAWPLLKKLLVSTLKID